MVEKVGRPPLLTLWKENLIIEILYSDPKATVKELRNGLRKELAEKLRQRHPTLTQQEIDQIIEPSIKKDDDTQKDDLAIYSAYQLPGESAISKWLEKKNVRENVIAQLEQSGELDKEWNIGACACVKYGLPIPAEMVPLLFEINEEEKKSEIVPNYEPKYVDPGRPLTLRLARWIAYLYPIAKKSKPILEYLKNDCEPGTEITDSPSFKGVVLIMAGQYARSEQLAEIKGSSFPDTEGLDNLYFINGNADIVKGNSLVYEPEQYKNDLKALESFSPISLEKWKSLLGKNEMTQEQADILNDWIRNYELRSQVEPHEAVRIDKKLRAEHPEMVKLFDFFTKLKGRFIY